MAGRATQVTKIPVVDRDPFDFPPATDQVRYKGVNYVFRELTVQETDQAREDSTIGDVFDGRLMTRLMICAAAIEPTMTMEQLSKLPQRLYAKIVDVVNDLNDPDALKDEDLGKS